MIKLKKGLLYARLSNDKHKAIIVLMEHKNAAPLAAGTASTLSNGRETTRFLNEHVSGNYPRYIAVSKSTCYFGDA